MCEGDRGLACGAAREAGRRGAVRAGRGETGRAELPAVPPTRAAAPGPVHRPRARPGRKRPRRPGELRRGQAPGARALRG